MLAQNLLSDWYNKNLEEMTAERDPVNTWIVDDDNVYVYGLKKLIKIKGINAKISHFGNGQEAINALKKPTECAGLPHLILLDINMPLMDGWEFLNEFAEIKSRLGNKIAIYIISSSINLDDIDRAKKIPEIFDYIFKPVSTKQLAQIFDPGQAPSNEQLFKYGA